ncbi:7927_t:CDS:2, partial [Entrophospora sp. SA101]
KGPGHSVMIVIGGAGESLSARPGVYELILKKRLGFVRLAIRCGACLVPVFSFGENDIWEQADNPRENDIGVLPHRRQITTVVIQNANPSDEEVLKIQEEYIEELFKIWNDYKD